jgi:hypothetical protein
MHPEKSPPSAQSWRDGLRQRCDRLLSGRAQSDPLYLTNRTAAQKLKVAALIAVPFLILGALATAGVMGMFHFNKAGPYERPPAEAQAAVPTRRTADLRLTPRDLEVVNIHIAADEKPPVVTGVIRNNTSRKVDSAEVSFDLADARGSLMGTETTQVQNVGPHSTVSFRAPLKTANADYVMIRDVHSN